MNSVEFLNEVKNSPLCPKKFEEIYAEFCEFQKAALETLMEVHRICEKNQIPYQVTYGSLLGAIRDGTQIPWDYDVDIMVPYEEKANLLDALKKDLDEKFYYYCPENHKECRHVITRVTPVGYRSEALHVDIFYFVGRPDDLEERAQYTKKIRKLARARYGKLVNIWEETLGDPVAALKLFLRRKLPTIFTSLKQIEKEYNEICSRYPATKSKYCVSADISATGKQIPSEILWDTKLYDCDFGTVRVPVRYDELLTLFYRDYRAVPALESRIEEMVRHHKRIKSFREMK